MFTPKFFHEKYMTDTFFVCIDDAKPSFDVTQWIEEGRTYKVIVGSQIIDINSGEVSFQFEDEHGNLILPNPKLGVKHFRLSRFKPVCQVSLN